MQYQLGSCNFDQIAVAMACPVVAKHADRNEIIVYGGGVHFSKQFIEINGNKVYGLVVNINNNGWEKIHEDNCLVKVSQEHGTIKVSQDLFDKTAIGDIIGIIPVHSCMTANLMQEYLSIDDEVIDHLSGSKN